MTEFDNSGNALENSTDTTNQYYVGMFAFGQGYNAAKVFVYGTTNLTSDEYISGYGMNDVNVEFFRSSIRELTSSMSTADINVATKNVDNFSLNSTKVSTSSSTLIMVIFMIFIPVILVGAAVIVYAKRKNL